MTRDQPTVPPVERSPAAPAPPPVADQAVPVAEPIPPPRIQARPAAYPVGHVAPATPSAPPREPWSPAAADSQARRQRAGGVWPVFAAAMSGIVALLGLVYWLASPPAITPTPTAGLPAATAPEPVTAEPSRRQPSPDVPPADRSANVSGRAPQSRVADEVAEAGALTDSDRNEWTDAEIDSRDDGGGRPVVVTEQSGHKTVPAARMPTAGSASPAEQLAALGLTRREQFWVLGEDDDLVEILVKLDGLEDQARQLAAQWNQVRESHHQWQRQFELARESRQIALANQARQQLQVGRQLLAQAMRAHSQQVMAALHAESMQESLSAAYKELAASAPVRNALADLDPIEHRWGPTTLFETNARRIGQASAHLLNAPLQCYWSDTQRDVFYIDVTVNDHAAWTCAVRPKAEYNLVPAQVLEQAGIDVPEEGGRQLNIGGVRFSATAVTLPSLRLGRFVSRDVPVLVLPKEIHRLEGFLCPTAFPDLKLAPLPKDGTLTISAAALPR